MRALQRLMHLDKNGLARLGRSNGLELIFKPDKLLLGHGGHILVGVFGVERDEIIAADFPMVIHVGIRRAQIGVEPVEIPFFSVGPPLLHAGRARQRPARVVVAERGEHQGPLGRVFLQRVPIGVELRLAAVFRHIPGYQHRFRVRQGRFDIP